MYQGRGCPTTELSGARAWDKREGEMNQPRIIQITPLWLAVDKPAGWLTIPGRDAAAPVLSDWARREHGEIWIVHRLDRETSGVVLFARTAEAHRQANLWFSRHEARKSYDLMAAGRPALPVFRINEPVEGQPSVTQVEVRESWPGAFLARAMPLTGRRHQIRIHLAGKGFPLLGDPRYGGASEVRLRGEPLPIGRVALHAAKLELPGGARFEAPWPSDFTNWVERLRAAARQEAAGV